MQLNISSTRSIIFILYSTPDQSRYFHFLFSFYLKYNFVSSNCSDGYMLSITWSTSMKSTMSMLSTSFSNLYENIIADHNM